MKDRYAFLDLYRGIIVLFMLEGHVLREVLSPAAKLSSLFQLHELIHGITAPGFLFGAGFTFAVATQRRWEQVTVFAPSFFRRAWRPLMLILIGYLLHVPFLSLQKTLAVASNEQWEQFLSFDALQCIGFSMLAMRVLLVLVRRERPFLVGTIVLFAIAAFGAPIAWSLDAGSGIPLLLESAANGLRGSVFPVFPYAAYVFAGTAIAWSFLRAVERNVERYFIVRLALGGAIVIIGGFTLDTLPVRIYAPHDFWTASPNYFFIKLGLLLLLLCGLWQFENLSRVQALPSYWLPRWLTITGIESLFVYIAHLILLYGWVLNPEANVRSVLGGQLNGVAGPLASIAFAALLVPCASLWHYLKKHHAIMMGGWFWWMGIAAAYSFFVNPY